MANYWFIYKDTDGSLYSHYLGDATEWTNIPEGCSVLGAIPDTDQTAQDAFMYPDHYIIKDGALFFNISDQQQLDFAKNQQKSLITEQYNNSIYQPVQSSALGTPHTYLYNAMAKTRYDAIYARFHNDQTYLSEDIFTLEAGNIPHNKDQFTQVWTDAFNIEKAYVNKYTDIITKITTLQLSSYLSVGDAIANVKKITWQ